MEGVNVVDGLDGEKDRFLGLMWAALVFGNERWPPAASWRGPVMGGAPKSAERSAYDRKQLSINI
eukprot:1156896-Pelagomonas_calceolata.AAC.7